MSNNFQIMKFYSYSSIKKAKSSFVSPPITWVGTEKIHGSNFSFHFDCENGEIKCARRNSFLMDDDKFYGWKEMRVKYAQQITKMCREIMTFNEGCKQIIIYGEMCGGGAKPVQKGVFYSEEYEFIAFDLAIVPPKGNKTWLRWAEMNRWLKSYNFFVSPVVAMGSYEEVVSTNPKFESLIPRMLGLSDVPEGNYAEGFVMRSASNDICDKQGERVTFKIKTHEFAEIKPQASSSTQSCEIDDVDFGDVERYITFPRVECVMSKMTEDEKKNVKRVAGLLCGDIIKDYEWPEDYFESPNGHVMKGRLYRSCLDFLSQHY